MIMVHQWDWKQNTFSWNQWFDHQKNELTWTGRLKLPAMMGEPSTIEEFHSTTTNIYIYIYIIIILYIYIYM